MNKYIRSILLLGTVLLLAGCSSLAATQAVPTQVPQTPTIIYVVVTATPAPTEVPTETPAVTETPIPPTDTTVPTATVKIIYPTSTPSAYDTNGNAIKAEGSLRITNIEDRSGRAVISWTATGTNPNGFWIYYSTSFQNPYYGGYAMFKIPDGNARTAYLDGDPGVTYYYRICHYTGSGCDYYSNSITYTYPGATATP